MKNYIVIICIGILMSCGSRKANKSMTKDKSKSRIEVQADVKTAENLKVENIISENKSTSTESKSEEKENHMKPIDPNKPIKRTETTNGNTKTTTWENAEVMEKSKKEDSKKNEDSKLTDNSVFTSGSTLEASAKLRQAEEKSSERIDKRTDVKRGFYLWWMLLLIILFLTFVYWKYFKKNSR